MKNSVSRLEQGSSVVRDSEEDAKQPKHAFGGRNRVRKSPNTKNVLSGMHSSYLVCGSG